MQGVQILLSGIAIVIQGIIFVSSMVSSVRAGSAEPERRVAGIDSLVMCDAAEACKIASADAGPSNDPHRVLLPLVLASVPILGTAFKEQRQG